jgi:hypothetical protein
VAVLVDLGGLFQRVAATTGFAWLIARDPHTPPPWLTSRTSGVAARYRSFGSWPVIITRRRCAHACLERHGVVLRRTCGTASPGSLDAARTFGAHEVSTVGTLASRRPSPRSISSSIPSAASCSRAPGRLCGPAGALSPWPKRLRPPWHRLTSPTSSSSRTGSSLSRSQASSTRGLWVPRSTRCFGSPRRLRRSRA